MKKRGVFINCIAIPFLAAIVCLVLMTVFQLVPVRNVVMRLIGRLFLLFGGPGRLYPIVMNTIAILPCLLFCCRAALKSKQAKKIIRAVVFSILLAIGFGFGSNFILSMTDSVVRASVWSLVLNFAVAAAVLIIFNLFFTPEFKESKEIYEAMEESRKEAERKAQLALFMSSPSARHNMALNAVAYKSKRSNSSAIKGAVIGGVVAGPAGAAVGAIVGQNKADQKTNAPTLDPARQAVAYKKDDGTKTIVKDAIIGGAVAGPAGAVVGAVVGKNKVDQNNK